jgi:4-amino-4-deoxy-L-arabinose transferase-like glycosyltransferase
VTRAAHRATPVCRASVAALPLILAIQAFMSIRLIWKDTAYQDEALYLWVGHLEIAHWLHGVRIPAFPTYISGAPVVYPPLAAVADSLGGLVAARLLSLLLMLGATALLWCAVRILFDRSSAFFAAALWASLGPTIQLGAFATFDAMSMFLMAAAVCCVARASVSRQATGWMLAAAAALVLSNITAYSSMIFDPVLFALTALAPVKRFGLSVARTRLSSLLAYMVTLLTILAKIGGSWYVQGFDHTVLNRVAGTSTIAGVVRSSWSWIGFLLVLGCVGFVICLFAERYLAQKLIFLTLLIAGLLAPAEQARIHTLTSLDKHADVGAWFAAIAAGYGVSKLISYVRPHLLRTAAYATCALALCFPLYAGAAQASALTDWPDAAALVTRLGPVIASHPGAVLIETPSILEYYLSAGAQWKRWSSTYNITLPTGKVVEHSGKVGYPGHPQTYRKYIQEGYFSVIALNHGLANSLDRLLIEYIAANHNYRPEAVIPYGKSGYTVWVLTRKKSELPTASAAAHAAKSISNNRR